MGGRTAPKAESGCRCRYILGYLGDVGDLWCLGRPAGACLGRQRHIPKPVGTNKASALGTLDPAPPLTGRRLVQRPRRRPHSGTSTEKCPFRCSLCRRSFTGRPHCRRTRRSARSGVRCRATFSLAPAAPPPAPPPAPPAAPVYDLEAPLSSASSQLQLEQSLEQSLEQFEMTRDDAVDLIDGNILNMLGLDPSASHLPGELP